MAQGPAIFLFSFAFADCLHSFKLLIKILHPCTITMVIKVGFLHLSIGDGIDEFRSWESKWKILISVALVALTWMNQISFTIFCLFLAIAMNDFVLWASLITTLALCEIHLCHLSLSFTLINDDVVECLVCHLEFFQMARVGPCTGPRPALRDTMTAIAAHHISGNPCSDGDFLNVEHKGQPFSHFLLALQTPCTTLNCCCNLAFLCCGCSHQNWLLGFWGSLGHNTCSLCHAFCHEY